VFCVFAPGNAVGVKKARKNKAPVGHRKISANKKIFFGNKVGPNIVQLLDRKSELAVLLIPAN